MFYKKVVFLYVPTAEVKIVTSKLWVNPAKRLKRKIGICFSPFWLLQQNSTNSRCLFLTVLEAGKSKIKVWTWFYSGEDPLSFIAGPFLLCPHMVEWTKELSGISFSRALILLMRTPSHDPLISQRPQLDIRISPMNFEGTHIQTIAVWK